MTDTQTRREARLTVARAALTPRSYDAENHTVELIAATGFPVRRYDWEAGTYYLEQLDISEAAIDGSRIDQGVCPMLNAHSSWAIGDQLGRIESWRVENGQLITVARFGVSDAAVAAEAEVAAGTWRGVSVGYRRDEMLKEVRQDGKLPTYKVTRWGLMEVSLVPIPADPASGVRSEDDLHPCSIIENRDSTDTIGAPDSPEEDETMIRSRMLGGVAALAQNAPNDNPGGAPASEVRSEPATPAVQSDPNVVRMDVSATLDFMDDVRTFGVDETQARTWATTLTPDGARAALIRAAAEVQRGQAPLQPGQRQNASITHDDRDKQREAMSNAIQHRFNPSVELTDGGRQFRSMSLMEMARENLERNGTRTRGLGKRELADLALRQHSTSDFPNVLSNVTRATLRSGYAEAPQTFKGWQRRATVSDFRQVSRLQMGSAPSFLLVPEGGEFKMGTIGDGKEVYALATYGRKFAITRQTLINDDVDAFTRIPGLMGAAAARFESDAAYAPLIANPNMSDGVALFHASHGNLAASGGAIAEAGVQAAEIAMGKQVGLGGEILNLAPKFMIVARKDALPARKLMTAVQATQTSGVNVYSNAFEIIVESRLNRTSGATPWFMAADPNQVDTIEYAYLDGDDGVFLDEREGFDVDGIEYKARLDFAVKAIDWRGLYQDPGT
ncbi:prohead protease/major capsid protein fusion protein [Brevundimonas subvibrioides]|uniref:Peptidase U35 phage prohead HK97 n=1 Tax=Brevundimonas subvibrioides (strain ATCC 15264 / DSM 4735 / LMG 14903 / NBRC 16000 / CB 81) TaxID=633149 RepID=D9QI92_BRESC|nr:prohead protease/major capsid protein fusion protein [Brevundimonas subvibrioides]ADK99394.1 peptidase U35 phage prohead HK97 [Brevundimonas subvibrioides ATCC 15264]